MPGSWSRRRARVVALAAAAVTVPLALLALLAASQVRYLAAALRSREEEALRQGARAAALELAQRIEQAENEVFGALDLNSLAALSASLEWVEEVFPEAVCWILLRDGSFLYPLEAREGPPAPPLDSVAREGPRLLEAVGESGLARRIVGGTNGETLAVSLRRAELPLGRGLIGVGWRPPAVAAWADAAARAALPARYVLRLYDRQGRPLLPGGEPGRPATDACALCALPATDFPWDVAVLPRDAKEIDRIVRREVLIHGGALGFLAVIGFAGAWRLARLTLREMELARLKSEFAANVSHELRTPLALIRAAGESLARRPDLSKPQTERYVGLIVKESRRLTDLIDTILDFSRLDRQRQRYDLTTRDLVPLVAEVAETYRPHLEEQGFRFQVELPAEPLPAAVNAEALRLMLANLLDNAVKFSLERKEIALRLFARGGEAALSVRDWGIGIAPEHQATIFEGFYRVEGELVKKTRGAGLGLALVRRMAAAHGGRITVQSAPGQGAEFTLWLPRRSG